MKNNRIKCLFIINQFYRGGAENSLLAMLKLLPSDKYDIYLAIYDQSRKGAGLVPKVPKHIHLCVERKYFFLWKYAPKYSQKILRFVSSTFFDLAISFGEWMSPQLLVSYATARKKVIWLHNDVSLINTPHASDLFSYDSFVDQYVCVSKLQAKITANAFPFLEQKCSYVHNPLLADEILKESEKESPNFVKDGKRLIVSIGNLRPQKNYLRAVRVAKLLKDMKISFRWLVIGALDDKDYVRQIKKQIKEYQLDEDIVLLGPKMNPWCYLRCADVLVSSSDFESWGMVFAEARALAIPVVATKTTGACEQVEDRKSGLLSEFSDDNLAMCIKEILQDANTHRRIKRNILATPLNFDFLAEFSKLLIYNEANHSDTVFFFDSVNYYGGAHIASSRLVKELWNKKIKIDIFSADPPTNEGRKLFYPATVVHCDQSYETIRWFVEAGFMEICKCKGVPLIAKFEKLCNSIYARIWKKNKMIKMNDCMDIWRILCRYKKVCIMSEGSQYRYMISTLPQHISVIQFIHTFYEKWSKFNDWTKKITSNDAVLYERMNKIYLVGQRNVDKFNALFPNLSHKTKPFYNIIKVDKVSAMIKLLTIARIEPEKDFRRMIRIAVKLKESNVNFIWTICGDGSSMQEMKAYAKELKVDDVFHFIGYVSKPSIWIKNADLLVLLSRYEGLPNVIFESFILGVPVFSTKVGGVEEQIIDGFNGRLVDDSEDVIIRVLKNDLKKNNRISVWKKNLENYQYDNKNILQSYMLEFNNAANGE